MDKESDKRTAKETTEAFEKVVKTMLATPPEPKNGDGRKAKRRRRNRSNPDA